MSKEYHVSKKGSDTQEGSEKNPFLTISKAAKVAQGGDTIIVHGGTYREWVSPENGGSSPHSRITYQVAKGEKAIIKGSEEVKSWEKVERTVWKTVLPNSLFGDFNPYTERLMGDWLMEPRDKKLHLGDVYLNGISFFEAQSIEEVTEGKKHEIGYFPTWVGTKEYLANPEQSIYKWYAEVDDQNTTIYANFHSFDPNREYTEVNVRKCCFYPKNTHVNYITVKGFEMAQAACPWTPPTADQPGMLGTHWSRGWVIENNIFHDAKCSAVSLGKDAASGDNRYTKTKRKAGYHNQLESVFLGLQQGWDKDTIGSHIVRNNTMFDCGQNGVVGHMGCAFSEVSGNHIYRIGTKYEWFGHEIAGIKFHAPIDTIISGNNIHHCGLGIWLDWQVQGTRITSNLLYENYRDFMVEVTHGPHLVDNNIFASDFPIHNVSQGGAFLHNFIGGSMRSQNCLDRATPYHVPHSTTVAGVAVVYAGDDRWYQNIWLGDKPLHNHLMHTGTSFYDEFHSNYEDYHKKVSTSTKCDLDGYLEELQPAYINNNVYFTGAKACVKEKNQYSTNFDPKIKFTVAGKDTYMEFDLDQGSLDLATEIFNTEKLGTVRLVDQAFESPSGESITFDTDFLGEKRGNSPKVGPLEKVVVGHNRIKVWTEK